VGRSLAVEGAVGMKSGRKYFGLVVIGRGGVIKFILI